MKVALIGDVHANLPALEAVLAHAQKQGVEAIWNIGDWVGYNAFPNEVVERLQKERAVSIIGNYDLKVLRFKKKQEKWQQNKHPQKYLAFKWAYETLSKKNRKYLRSLPKEIVFKFANRSILLTHASPASIEEAIFLDTPEARLQELAEMAGTDVIIFGHSHQPFVRQVNGVWFINTGTVGRPAEGDPRAGYAVLTLSAKNLQVQHYCVGYNVERAVAAIRKNKLPEEFAKMLLQGCSLDQVVMP